MWSKANTARQAVFAGLGARDSSLYQLIQSQIASTDMSGMYCRRECPFVSGIC